MLSPLRSMEEVAEYFGVNRDAVASWRASGELPGININRNKNSGRPTWRFREEDIAAFELARRSIPPPKPSKTRKSRQAAEKDWF